MIPAAGNAARRGRLEALAALPVSAYLLLFLALPCAFALKLAFTDTLTGGVPSLANFRRIAADALLMSALVNNVMLAAVSVAAELALGLGLALLFRRRFRGYAVLRAAVVIPFALPEIVYLTAMRYVFAPHGYANSALAAASLAPVEWLSPGSWMALLTVAAVDAWHVTPIVFLILASALGAIPEHIFEAARLDGARGWRQLVHITLPLLRPAILAAVMLRGLDALRVFAAPLVLTGVEGLPVLSSYAYHQWSEHGDDAAAAAVSMLLAVLCVITATPLLRKGQTR
ncbi:MAG: carbohydrate ABC transporter permease [Candidatus Binatia bacterium]